MPSQLPILAIPSQSLSIALGGDFYDLRIKACKNIMAVDIVRNQTLVVTGMRALANYPLIPYKYLQHGNFYFFTNNDDYPWYQQFNINQYLFFLSQAEIDAL